MPSKLLIVGPSWVGDMVMAQTLFTFLKAQQPDLIIDILAPAWTEPLLARMPEIRRAILSPFKHGELSLKARYALGKSLRSEQYDQAIVLPNSLKSALVPFWAKIPKRTGWRGEMRYVVLNDLRPLDKKKYPLMIQRFAALALPKNDRVPEQLPWPSMKTHDTDVNAALASLQIERPTQPVLALCPGAEFGPAKRWLPEHFASVANHFSEQGWQIWLFGSPNDMPVAQEIQSQCKHPCVDLVGKTKLAEAIDLMSLTTVVVANDSGLMHIAASLDKPLVALYGPTSPGFTPPLSNKVGVLSTSLDCSPCSARECPLQHGNCMKELLPGDVITEILQLKGSA